MRVPAGVGPLPPSLVEFSVREHKVVIERNQYFFLDGLCLRTDRISEGFGVSVVIWKAYITPGSSSQPHHTLYPSLAEVEWVG